MLYPEPQPDVAISVWRKQRGSGDLRPYKPSESNRYSVGGSILPWSMAAGKNRKISDTVGFLGCLSIVAAEIYEFLTWHILTVSGKFSLDLSFRLAYPEFYIGLAVSIFMAILYTVIVFQNRKVEFKEG